VLKLELLYLTDYHGSVMCYWLQLLKNEISAGENGPLYFTSIYLRIWSLIWSSGQALGCMPWGHGFNFHPGGQGVCRSILLEPSGVDGSLGYRVYKDRSDFDCINLIFTLRSPPLLELGSVMHLACNTAWVVCTSNNHWSFFTFAFWSHMVECSVPYWNLLTETKDSIFHFLSS